MPFEAAEPRSALTVVFEPNLPLADMKARLVLNRLSSKARILSTDPPAEQLDEVDPLTRFTVYLAAECDPDELRALADVEGVAEIRIEPARPRVPERGTPAATEPVPLVVPQPERPNAIAGRDR